MGAFKGSELLSALLITVSPPTRMSSSLFGNPLLQFAELDSTNKTAAELLARGEARHGTAIVAHAQRHGVGQRGRTWTMAPALDLALSIVTEPHGLRADAQFALSKAAALAVHDTVRDHVSGDVRIKWPNDVLVGRHKVAGILIRNELSGDRVAASIIGIGLNVNNTDLDPALVATSLALETGRALDRMAVLHELLERFGQWWRRWEATGDAALEAYAERLWMRNRWAAMELDGALVQARAMDVDSLGRLIVEVEGGTVAAYGLDRLRFAPR